MLFSNYINYSRGNLDSRFSLDVHRHKGYVFKDYTDYYKVDKTDTKLYKY